MRAAVHAGLSVVAALQLGYASAGGAGVIDLEEATRSAAPGIAARLAPVRGADDFAGFEVVWFGVYTVSGIRRVHDLGAPAQSRGVVLGHEAPVQNRTTMRVPARVGLNFGVAFKFRDASEERPVNYRAIWRFPKPGLVNPEKTTFLKYESAPSSCQSKVCVHGWSFSEPWELVIGTWTMELWRGSTKLHEQAFEVVSP